MKCYLLKKVSKTSKSCLPAPALGKQISIYESFWRWISEVKDLQKLENSRNPKIHGENPGLTHLVYWHVSSHGTSTIFSGKSTIVFGYETLIFAWCIFFCTAGWWSLYLLTAFLFKNFQIFEDIDKDRNGVITRKEPLGDRTKRLAGETPETFKRVFLFLIPVMEWLDPQHSAS